MADGLPPIEFDIGTDGAPVVIVAEAEARDLDSALRLAPALGDPQWLIAYAQVANHLAQGDRYEVIVDPAEFRAAYMAAYEAEDPDEPPAPGLIRLHNYGLPDFDSIAAPHMEGENLVFHAENVTLGIPYRATMSAAGDVVYEPVEMGG